MKKQKLKIKIGNLELKNPVLLVSGTCGYGEEIKSYVDFKKIGGIITKTITVEPREGNPVPRICETPSGMLNSIGLENKGLKDFVYNKTDKLKNLGTAVIVSIAGGSIDEFSKMAEELSGLDAVSALELNLSCPNVSHSMKADKYKLTAQDKDAAGKVVENVKKRTKLPVIAKLSPNITDIKEVAKAVEGAGADAIAVINTLFGVRVDINTRKPMLARGAGGLSGPAVKPVALYFVREVYSAVKVPIIGMGGIMTAEDAIEFIICGASAVGVGTANFVDPSSGVKIAAGIKTFMEKNDLDDIIKLTGTLRT